MAMSDSIDLSSDPGPSSSSAAPAKRPFVGVHFACCHVYQRVYVTPGSREVLAHCPRCAKRMRLQVVEGEGPRENTIQVS